MENTVTVEQVSELKRGWEQDPCWDIEDTPGFEEFHDELHLWRLEFELNRVNKRYAALVNALRAIKEAIA